MSLIAFLFDNLVLILFSLLFFEELVSVLTKVPNREDLNFTNILQSLSFHGNDVFGGDDSNMFCVGHAENTCLSFDVDFLCKSV